MRFDQSMFLTDVVGCMKTACIADILHHPMMPRLFRRQEEACHSVGTCELCTAFSPISGMSSARRVQREAEESVPG